MSEPTPSTQEQAKTPMNEADKEKITAFIEKNYHSSDTSIPASELLTNLIHELKGESSSNPLVQYLIANSEKNISGNDVRSISGQLGIDKYKDFATMTTENSKSTKGPEASENEAKKELGKHKLKDPDQRENTIHKEKEEMVDLIAKKWMEENKELLSTLSPEKALTLARRVAIDSLDKAIKQQPTNPQNPQDPQGQGGQPMQGQQTGNILAAATRIATATSALVTGILAGTVAGVHAGGGMIKNSLSQIKKTDVSNNHTNYANELADQTSTRMFERTDSIYDSLNEMNKAKEKGKWTIPSEQEKVYSKIEKDLSELNELKNTLKKDAMRDGVTPEKRKEINDDLTSVSEFLNSFEDTLNDNEREKGLKEQASKIAKAIERILKSIKDLLFSKDNDKENNKPEDNNPSYEP